MRSEVAIGAGAGLIGGVVGAGVLSIVAIKGSEGEMTRAVGLVAHAAHSDSFALGWLVLMAAGLLIGARSELSTGRPAFAASRRPGGRRSTVSRGGRPAGSR